LKIKIITDFIKEKRQLCKNGGLNKIELWNMIDSEYILRSPKDN